MYELSAVGVPFIGFSYAKNQEMLVEYLGANDVAGNAGAWHKDRDKTLEQIGFLFRALCSDFEMRRKYAIRERTMVDGQGAGRLARALYVEETDI